MRGIAAGDSLSPMLALSDTVTTSSEMFPAPKSPSTTSNTHASDSPRAAGEHERDEDEAASHARNPASLAARDDGGAARDAAAALPPLT